MYSDVFEAFVNRINPKKLLRSKWTAVKPVKKERHFLVTDVEFDEEGIVVVCEIEAVISNRSFLINWQDLKNKNEWISGWK